MDKKVRNILLVCIFLLLALAFGFKTIIEARKLLVPVENQTHVVATITERASKSHVTYEYEGKTYNGSVSGVAADKQIGDQINIVIDSTKPSRVVSDSSRPAIGYGVMTGVSLLIAIASLISLLVNRIPSERQYQSSSWSGTKISLSPKGIIAVVVFVFIGFLFVIAGFNSVREGISVKENGVEVVATVTGCDMKVKKGNTFYTHYVTYDYNGKTYNIALESQLRKIENGTNVKVLIDSTDPDHEVSMPGIKAFVFFAVAFFILAMTFGVAVTYSKKQ